MIHIDPRELDGTAVPVHITKALREQLRIEEQERLLARHHDLMMKGADWIGAAGIGCAAALILWLAARCGPTLLPWIFA